MINRDLIEVFSEIAREKNVDRSELGSILEQLFLHIIEKDRGDSNNCSVIVNLDKGEIEIYAEKIVVESVEDPISEITLEEIVAKDPDLSDMEVGETYVEVIDPRVFGRRLIHTAKQFFAQRIQDIEKQYIYEDYAQRIGEFVLGTVHQVQRDNIYVNIDHAEMRMPKKEQISFERYRRGDTVRAIIKSVEITPRGPDIIISRSDNHFLFKLFEMEVPEIEDGVIEIKAIARYPGDRAKIIVQSNDRRIDPVGACVGMRGSRIQAIVRELDMEKIDIVNYSDQAGILISRALSPAKPLDLYIDEDRKYCMAIFNDDELDSAIGKGGVNINLASRITEFKIDAFGKNEYERKQIEQNTELSTIHKFPVRAQKHFADNNIKTVSDLLDAEEEVLLDIKGISEAALEKSYDAVQQFIESQQQTEEEQDGKQEENVSAVDNITKEAE
ncbi:MAG: transcription termination factor NusA [Candidatus Neomarinimicrobiota bacterium]